MDVGFYDKFAFAFAVVVVNTPTISSTNKSQVAGLMQDRFGTFLTTNHAHAVNRVMIARHVRSHNILGGQLTLVTACSLLDGIRFGKDFDLLARLLVSWRTFEDEGYDMTLPSHLPHVLNNPRAANCEKWSTDGIHSLPCPLAMPRKQNTSASRLSRTTTPSSFLSATAP